MPATANTTPLTPNITVDEILCEANVHAARFKASAVATPEFEAFAAALIEAAAPFFAFTPDEFSDPHCVLLHTAGVLICDNADARNPYCRAQTVVTVQIVDDSLWVYVETFVRNAIDLGDICLSRFEATDDDTLAEVLARAKVEFDRQHKIASARIEQMEAALKAAA